MRSSDKFNCVCCVVIFFFFNDTATTEIYTLSLHDALPIWFDIRSPSVRDRGKARTAGGHRSEEHTSELQSRFGISYAVFCLKKKTRNTRVYWGYTTFSTNRGLPAVFDH